MYKKVKSKRRQIRKADVKLDDKVLYQQSLQDYNSPYTLGITS